MRNYFILFAVVILLTGCKTKVVTVTESHTDTLTILKHQRDSIFMHDSTFVREYIMGDTVRIITERWHTAYRDLVRTDTVYRSRVDSVPQPYPVIKEVKKPLTHLEKGLMGTGIASVVGLLFYLFIRIKKFLP